MNIINNMQNKLTFLKEIKTYIIWKEYSILNKQNNKNKKIDRFILIQENLNPLYII